MDDWWYAKLVSGHYAVFWARHEQQAKVRGRPCTLSAEAKKLIEMMLNADPVWRISVPAILGDSFTSGLRYEYVCRESPFFDCDITNLSSSLVFLLSQSENIHVGG